MSKFLDYPVRNPINQANLFGENPAQYKPLGQAGHPGNDFEAPTGTPVFAPCDGVAFYTRDTLGGDGIWIRTTDSDGNHYNVILWHMPTVGTPIGAQYPYSIPTDNFIMTPVKRGQKIGYTDNSGFPGESTGAHLHVGVQPCSASWIALAPTNGYLGCVDPQQFYTGNFADEVNMLPAAIAAVNTASAIVAQVKQAPSITSEDKSSLLDEIKKVVTLLEEIF